MMIGCAYKPPLIPLSIFCDVEAVLSNIVLGYYDAITLGNMNVTDPTRISESSSTTIDNMALSKPLSVLDSRSRDIFNITDHLLIFYKLTILHAHSKPHAITYIYYCKFSSENVASSLCFHYSKLISFKWYDTRTERKGGRCTLSLDNVDLEQEDKWSRFGYAKA